SFFFFQAEDGIRDFHVTGVQTCALPISIVAFDVPGCRDVVRHGDTGLLAPFGDVEGLARSIDSLCMDERLRRRMGRRGREVVARSEERRVGKEGSCREWRYAYKNRMSVW